MARLKGNSKMKSYKVHTKATGVTYIQADVIEFEGGFAVLSANGQTVAAFAAEQVFSIEAVVGTDRENG